ncbi:MAG TPA: SpoIIE family protein phosphatase, partial [Tepidisphaeraceae bacterium]|nr:SpoIIE family protein phosphatase [Tepidisphaeraceae bacterium]
MVLLAVWLGAGGFGYKVKVREKGLGRLVHGVPLYLGFWLCFAKRGFGPLDYRLYWNNEWGWLGTVVTLAGVGFAFWARAAIGRYWSGWVELKVGHRLIRHGPYAITRHPIYTGFLVGAFGTAISAGRVDALVGVAIIAASFVHKLRKEERLLTGEFGEEYVRYRREVPALFPSGWLGAEENRPIESEAFQAAAVRSDRYRIIGMLCICGAFAVLDVVSVLNRPWEMKRYALYLSWWGVLAGYEVGFLVITNRGRKKGKPIRSWLWVANTVLECLLPSLALLGLTADKGYLGPYRAMVSSAVAVYFFFIILSTLRLSPLLSIIAGLVSSLGYMGVYGATVWLAPRNDYRDFMPERVFVLFGVMLAGAGVLAAGVARQIRRHVIAALAEAETRLALDRMEYDLNIARSIQMGLLPQGKLKVEGYDIAGWSRPAEQTGGDYYDWVELPGGKWMFTIADATGHGIGPALLVAACRAYVRAVALRGDSLEGMVRRVDELIAADVPAGRFITAAVAVLEAGENRVSLYSAGQAPIYFYSAGRGRVESLEADQPPLG